MDKFDASKLKSNDEFLSDLQRIKEAQMDDFEEVNEKIRKRIEQIESADGKLTFVAKPEESLFQTCVNAVTANEKRHRDITVDIESKRLEIARAQAELDGLKERRQKIEADLSGARAAIVAMNVE